MLKRVMWGLLAAGLVAAPVVRTLYERVPDMIDQALSNPSASAVAFPTELPFPPSTDSGQALSTGSGQATSTGSGRGIEREMAVPLDVPNGAWLTGVEQLALLFATYDTQPRLIRGEIEVVGAGCIFRTSGQAQIINNGVTFFKRDGMCWLRSSAPQMILRLRIGAEGRVALWTYIEPRGAAHTANLVFDRGADGSERVVRGRALTTRTDRGARRIELLLFMWSGALSRFAFWWILGAGFVAVGAGVALVCGTRRVERVLGAGLIAIGLAGAWAVVMPPLQAADEPDHLLSFAKIAGDAAFPAELETLARRTHFDRLRFRPDEHFRPLDRGQPFARAWDVETHAEDTARRSPLTAAIWRTVAKTGWLDMRAPFAVLLRLRLLNTVLFALAIVAAAWLVTSGGRSSALWPLAGLALVPPLPYFATMVSDWTVLVSWVVVWSACVALLFREDGDTDKLGAPIGLAFGMLLASGTAGLALAPYAAALLAARIVVGPVRPSPQGRDPWLSAVMFWGGFTIAASVGAFLARGVFESGVVRADANAQAMSSFNSALTALGRAPWLVALLPIVAAGLEWAIGPLRRYAAVGTWTRRVVGVFLGAAVLWSIVALVLSNRLLALPVLPHPQWTDGVAYARAVVAHLSTSVRVTNFDQLLFTSFWSGFGWLETQLPLPVLTGLALMCVASFGALVLSTMRRRHTRALIWLAAIGVGGLASTIAVAVASFALSRNVHGRYLIGIYLPTWLVVSQVIANSLARACGPTATRWQRFWPIAFGFVAIGLHALSLTIVLRRYF